MYDDPFLCEIFFRNYIKYKHKHIDRLLLVLSPSLVDYVKNLLSRLNISNYEIVNNNQTHVISGAHANMIYDGLKIVGKNKDSHCFIDEQERRTD